MLIILVVVAAGALWGLSAAFFWGKKKGVPSEEGVDALLTSADYEGEDPAIGWSLTKKWAQAAIAQFGYCAREHNAQRDAVAAWLRKEMKGQCVRNCDIVRVVPYAVNAVFVPSLWDIDAARARRDPRVVARKLAMTSGNPVK